MCDLSPQVPSGGVENLREEVIHSMSFVAPRLVPLALCVVVLCATAAGAAPAKPAFGPFTDEGVYFQGQTRCSPTPKPGVVSFQRIVMDAYPWTGAGYISRACDVGGTSEHKEGRAWDWGVNVGVASQKAAADDLLAWLARDDGYGNPAAMGRRLGVMYAIWNRRIWFPGSGWSTYCVQRNGACRDPEDGGIRSPHTDHVHFSFTWRGANKKTTFWKPASTFASSAASSPWGGIWTAGRNGGIRILGSAGYHGAKTLKRSYAVAIAAHPGGSGYWMLTRSGRVFAFGDADRLGYVADMRGADIGSTPSGAGYWLLGRGGRVAPFGDAPALGSVPATEGPVIALAPTPSGAGYWVLAASGTVHAFGDAQPLGDAAVGAVDMVSTPTGAGYWVAYGDGRVDVFGDAPAFESLAAAPATPVVEVVPTSTGAGYWLVTAKGAALPVGAATALRARYTMTATSFEAREAMGSISE